MVFFNREEVMISIDERNDISPICPFCKIEINTILSQQISGFLGKRYIYYCPKCRSVLGVSHRKGFWMG